MTGSFTPVEGLNFSFVVSYVTYFVESAKYDSSAVTRLRRSDFMAAMYAFDLVLANFGIAIAARMPMITTTIRSSMRVKPRRVLRMGSFGVHVNAPRGGVGSAGVFWGGTSSLPPFAASVPAASDTH